MEYILIGMSDIRISEYGVFSHNSAVNVNLKKYIL